MARKRPNSLPAAGDPKITDRIVQDWLVQDVRGDRALVESRSGGLFDVGAGSVLPGLADGYVMAVALLVIGWVLAFGAEFHHLGERPETFLVDLLHPLSAHRN